MFKIKTFKATYEHMNVVTDCHRWTTNILQKAVFQHALSALSWKSVMSINDESGVHYLARVAPSGECLQSKGKMVHSVRG